MTESRPPTVIIGVGNHIKGDDAVGLRVIDALAETALTTADHIDLEKTGVDEFRLLATLKDRSTAIIVDALAGVPPGEVCCLSVPELKRRDMGHSLHDLSLSHVLEMGPKLYGDAYPEAVRLVGIGIETTAAGIGLSVAVESAVTTAVDTVRATVADLTNTPEPPSRTDSHRQPVSGGDC